MKKITLFLAILSLAVLVYGIVTTKNIQKTFKVNDNTELVVNNINGSVNIKGWDKDYVDVSVTKKSTQGSESLEDVQVTMNLNKVLSIMTKELKKNPKVSVNIEINVPKNLKISNIESSNGSISITEAGETGIVKTSNGSIKLVKCSGMITANSSNGSITAEEILGSVIAQTSNGRINLQNINGYVDAITSNGSIKIFNVVDIGTLKTSNASIKAHVSGLNDDVDIATSNGSITLYVSNELNANLRAKTSNGGIKFNEAILKIEELSKTKLFGQLGDGGNLLNVRTSNSSINIYKDSKILF